MKFTKAPINQLRIMQIREYQTLRLMLCVILSVVWVNSSAQTNEYKANHQADFSGIPYETTNILDRGVDANLPELGDTSQMVFSRLDEKRIGEQIMRQVSTSGGVIDDAEIVDYLQALGNRLARNGPDKTQQFNFFVVDDSSINAFAMPGGVIGVHTGLILAANTESELAGVLGHEIGHVTQRHLARMVESQKNATFKNIAGIALALLVARSNPELAQGALTASSAFGIQQQLDYTRAHEREADRVGLQILSNAGFDVRGMPAFFETLQRGNRFAEGAAPSFLRTHPLTTERISDVVNRVDQMPYKQVVDSPEFFYIKAKLRASSHFVDRNATQFAIDIFNNNIKEGRYQNEAAEHYGLAVAYLNQLNIEAAQSQMDWLQIHAEPHEMFANLQANIFVASQQSKKASVQFADALRRYPTNRALIYGYAKHLLALQQPDALINLVDDKLAYYGQDAYLFELKASAYAMQNKQLLRHQAQGEAYYRRYDLGRAIEQMVLAVNAKDGDYYQHSIVEARLKTLRNIQALNQSEDEKRGSDAP